jgi:hypothetical protein
MLVQSLGKDPFEGLVIAILFEQGESCDGPVEDVIGIPARGLTRGTWHATTLLGGDRRVKKKELRPEWHFRVPAA